MILAHGLPIELFYFLGACSLAAGTFVVAVAVPFACKWLSRIGHRSDQGNVIPVPHGGQSLVIALVPVLIYPGG